MGGISRLSASESPPPRNLLKFGDSHFLSFIAEGTSFKRYTVFNLAIFILFVAGGGLTVIIIGLLSPSVKSGLTRSYIFFMALGFGMLGVILNLSDELNREFNQSEQILTFCGLSVPSKQIKRLLKWTIKFVPATSKKLDLLFIGIAIVLAPIRIIDVYLGGVEQMITLLIFVSGITLGLLPRFLYYFNPPDNQGSENSIKSLLMLYLPGLVIINLSLFIAASIFLFRLLLITSNGWF